MGRLNRFAGDEATEALARQVIGCAMAVHRDLGPGFLESVYEMALAVEFERQGIAFGRQVPIEVTYQGVVVGLHRLDFLVDDRVVVEVKAIDQLLPIHRAQVLSYLKATNHRLGLLINFHDELLRSGIRRVIR